MNEQSGESALQRFLRIRPGQRVQRTARAPYLSLYDGRDEPHLVNQVRVLGENPDTVSFMKACANASNVVLRPIINGYLYEAEAPVVIVKR